MRVAARIGTIVLAFVTVAAATVSTASASNSGFPDYNRIADEHSKLCLAVSGGNGPGPIIQWGCTGSDDQWWKWDNSRFATDDNGNVYLLMRNEQNQCLIGDLTSLNGLQLDATTCNPGGGFDSAELWWAEDIGRDSDGNIEYRYHNFASQKCMADEGSSMKWGGAIVGWDCLNHDDQYWYVH